MQEVLRRDCDTSSCHLNAVNLKCRRTVEAEWANVSGSGLVTAVLYVADGHHVGSKMLSASTGLHQWDAVQPIAKLQISAPVVLGCCVGR